MFKKWPSPLEMTPEMSPTTDMIDSKLTNQSLGWVVQEQLQKVSRTLTNIETQLEVLSQVLWVRDSQELP